MVEAAAKCCYNTLTQEGLNAVAASHKEGARGCYFKEKYLKVKFAFFDVTLDSLEEKGGTTSDRGSLVGSV